MKEISENTKRYQERYLSAMHAVQTGVKMVLQYEKMDEEYTGACSRKHLRVGINSAMIDSAALAKTLIDAGVINEEDYFLNLAELAEAEKLKYEEELFELGGRNVKVTLG